MQSIDTETERRIKENSPKINPIARNSAMWHGF